LKGNKNRIFDKDIPIILCPFFFKYTLHALSQTGIRSFRENCLRENSGLILIMQAEYGAFKCSVNGKWPKNCESVLILQQELRHMNFKKLSTDELNRMDVPAFKASAKLPLVLVLDNIRSQHNTGSVFRTADAFRLEGIYLCGITATPPNREIHKAALGATESVDWKYFSSTRQCIEALRASGYVVVGAEQAEHSIPVQEFEPVPGMRYAIIAGNEVHGIDDDILSLCDICVEIPQYGTKHSLNVSVSAAIIIWEFYRKSGNNL